MTDNTTDDDFQLERIERELSNPSNCEQPLLDELVAYWGKDAFVTYARDCERGMGWPWSWGDDEISMQKYQSIAQAIPKHYKIVDLGCASQMQQYFFKDHAAYIGVDDDDDSYRFGSDGSKHMQTVWDFNSDCELSRNTTYYGDIQSFIDEYPEWTHNNDVFAVCKHVPDPEARSMVREYFPNCLMLFTDESYAQIGGRVVAEYASLVREYARRIVSERIKVLNLFGLTSDDTCSFETLPNYRQTEVMEAASDLLQLYLKDEHIIATLREMYTA